MSVGQYSQEGEVATLWQLIDFGCKQGNHE